MKIRIEVPVLLYADIELPTDATDDDGFTEAGKARVFELLGRALGEVGEELPSAPHARIELQWFTDARLYLTDHLFPVMSYDGLSLTSQKGDTPHADA